MKPPVRPGELIRVLLILALALPFAWNGYRLVHQLAVLPAVLGLLVMLVLGMVRLWTDRPRLPLWRRALPLILCLLAPIAGVHVGRWVERLDFHFRRQAHYRHVVEMLEKGEILSESRATQAFGLPHPYEGEANGALATRNTLGGLRVEFGWTRHSSYVYCRESTCTVDPRWKDYRRINEEWLLVRH